MESNEDGSQRGVGEKAKFSARLLVVFTSKSEADGRSPGGHGVCSKPRGLQRDVCVGGKEGGGGGCLEKFTESARRVTTQQSEPGSASSA